MDELDAICRARGSTTASAGVGDTVVNQVYLTFFFYYYYYCESNCFFKKKNKQKT